MSYIYKFEKEKCWYKEVCSKYETEECNPSCIRYMEMDFLMYNSNIPKNRQYSSPLIPSKQDYNSFVYLQDIKNDIVNFVNNGENVYIYSSNFGNGKTTWAIKLMQAWFDNIWAGNGFKCRGIFIHVPTFLSKIKDNINNRDFEFETLKSRLSNVDMVIWDDIASTKLSDFDHANLLTYIDQRNLQELSNIYTGNLECEELKNALGNRLSSRVWNNSLHVKFTGIDRRGLGW